jgi:hypothetical protein
VWQTNVARTRLPVCAAAHQRANQAESPSQAVLDPNKISCKKSRWSVRWHTNKQKSGFSAKTRYWQKTVQCSFPDTLKFCYLRQIFVMYAEVQTAYLPGD